MNLIILVEGPDGAGKSTLVNVMAEQTGYDVLRFSYPRSRYEELTMVSMYEKHIQDNDNVIFDRCWYSEMVYGPIKGRDPNIITNNDMLYLENLIVVKGGFVIHCTDSTENLWQRAKARGEDYVTGHSELHNIKVGYEKVFHHMKHLIPVFRYELNKKVL